MIAATASAQGIRDIAPTAEAATRGSAKSAGGWRAKEEQEEGRARRRQVPPRKQANRTANNDGTSKDVLSDADHPDSCRGNATAGRRRGGGVCEVEVPQKGQRYEQGGGGRRHMMQQENKKEPAGNDDRKKGKQHQLGQTYVPRDYCYVEESGRRETRGAGFDRQDDGGTSCCDIGNDAGTRISSIQPQERGEAEEKMSQQHNPHTDYTWERCDKEESGGVLDEMADHNVGICIGMSSDARQPRGSSPSAFGAIEVGGSGVQKQQQQQQRYRNIGQPTVHQPNPSISGQIRANTQTEEENSQLEPRRQPLPTTEAACARKSPLRLPSPLEGLSRVAPCSSSQIPSTTQPHPESERHPRQTIPQHLAVVVGVGAANVAADASGPMGSGGGDAWEGWSQAGEDDGRIQDKAFSLHGAFRGDQVPEPHGSDNCYDSSSTSGNSGGGSGGDSGRAVCGGGGCVRRLRERVTPRELGHHATCSSAVSQRVHTHVFVVARRSCRVLFPESTCRHNRRVASEAASRPYDAYTCGYGTSCNT